MKKFFKSLQRKISMLSIGKKLKLVNFMILFVPTFFAVIAVVLIYTFFISDSGDYISMLFKSKENVNIAYDSCEYVYDAYKKQLDEAGDENISDIYFETPAGTAYATVYKDGKLMYELEKENRPESYNELIEPLDKLRKDGKMFLVNGDYITYKVVIESRGSTYSVIVTGKKRDLAPLEKDSKLYGSVILVNMLFVIIVILLSYTLSKLLYKAIFDRVEYGLQTLTAALEEISQGNLDYRINYDRKDEFGPICEDFNIMAEKLQSSVMLSAQQEQTRKEIIMSVSHDIFSPLTSIKAYVEGLESGIADSKETQSKYLSVIKSKAEQIENMVSELLVYSKLEYNELCINLTNIDLLEFTKDFCIKKDDEYSLKNVQLGINDESENVTVAADVSLLMKLYTNIIDNSAKYSNHPVCHVEFKIYKDGNTCVLSVKDDGPGVPSASIDHIFEVFYRTDCARSHSSSGSGIGLSIVSNIVTRALRGKVKAKNVESGGLEIEIKLPITQEEP